MLDLARRVANGLAIAASLVLLASIVPGCRHNLKPRPPTFGIAVPPGPPDACAGEPYYYSFRAENGQPPYTWACYQVNTSTPLPEPAPGVTCDAMGRLTGVPTTQGTYGFDVEVTETGGSKTNFIDTFSIDVRTLAITTPDLPGTCPGEAVYFQMQACGGVPPLTWSDNGTLPAGLQISSDGRITGSTTVTTSTSVTITVTDSQSSKAQRTFTMPAGTGLKVTSPSYLPPGVISTPYPGYQLTACGGKAPRTWTVTDGSTAGLVLSSAGLLAGTPTQAGMADFEATVTDSSSTPVSTTHHAFLSIASAPLSITTTSPLPDADECKQYSTTLTANGGTGNPTWSLAAGSALPRGLALTPGGTIQGPPEQPATTPYGFTVQVADAGQSDSKALQLTVNEDTATSPELVIPEIRHIGTAGYDKVSLSGIVSVKVDFRLASTSAASVQPTRGELRVVGSDCGGITKTAFNPPADVNGDGIPEFVVGYNAGMVKAMLNLAGKAAGDRATLRFRLEAVVDGNPQTLVQRREVDVIP